MRATGDVVCADCGALATDTVSEEGSVTYEAYRKIRVATVKDDGSVEVVVESRHEGDDFFANFKPEGFRCSKCDAWGRTALDVIEREVVPEVGDRFWLKHERRNGVVQRVLTELDVDRSTRVVYVEIDGALYDWRDEEQLELISPHPDQLPLAIGGSA